MTQQPEESPDIDRLARSMLMLRGDHRHDHRPAPSRSGGSCSREPDFADDPQRAAAVREATEADKMRYLTSGLQPVDCRFCHVTVNVKRLGPGHTAVQWNTDALQRCAFFAELRANGTHSARSRSCPKLADSINHAVAEGCLESVPTATPPGDG
jgi:hypothetical protein